MKRTIALLTAIACLAVFNGCTSTNIEADTFSLKRTSFFQKLEIPEASISTNGTVLLKGYKTDGGNEALAALINMMSVLMAKMATGGIATSGVPINNDTISAVVGSAVESAVKAAK